MSKKKPNSEIYSSKNNIDSIDNKNKKQNITNQINQSENINFLKKRKRPYKKNISLKCFNCKKDIYTDIIKFKRKKDLTEKIKFKICKFKNYEETLNNNIKLINKIPGKFKKSKIICENCFEEIIIKDNCVYKIKKLFFNNKRTKINKKKSKFINKSNSEAEKGKNDNNEIKFINNKVINNFIDVYKDEYEECLKNIVLCIKMALLEVSFFAQSFKQYFDNSKIFINISLKILFNNYFSHSFIQTKMKLEYIYILINNIIIKFQNITNDIISSINKSNSYDGNEELKKNYDKFIQNTNLILSNILNFVNNYDILLSFFKCVNKGNDINKFNEK